MGCGSASLWASLRRRLPLTGLAASLCQPGRAARFVLALFMLFALPASLAHAHDFAVTLGGPGAAVHAEGHHAQAPVVATAADHQHQGPEHGAPHAAGLDCCLHHAPAAPIQHGPILPVRYDVQGDRVTGPQDLAPDGAPKTRLDRPPRILPSL